MQTSFVGIDGVEYPTRFVPLEDLTEIPDGILNGLNLGGFQKYQWYKKSEPRGLLYLLSYYQFSDNLAERPSFHFRRTTSLDLSTTTSTPRIDHRYSQYALGLDGLPGFKQNARRKLSSENFATLFSITKLDLEDHLEEKWSAGDCAETYLTFASVCSIPLTTIYDCSPRILDKWFYMMNGMHDKLKFQELQARALMSQYTEDKKEFNNMLEDMPALWVTKLIGK